MSPILSAATSQTRRKADRESVIGNHERESLNLF